MRYAIKDNISSETLESRIEYIEATLSILVSELKASGVVSDRFRFYATNERCQLLEAFVNEVLSLNN